MNKETEKRLLIFEGLSCCGKTTLINALSEDEECFPIIRIIRKIPRDLQSPKPEIFMKNDEGKFGAARDCLGIALMDRGYLSTLIFYTVMEEIRPRFSVERVRRWVTGSMGKTLFRPDYYIFVEVPPEVSRKRAQGKRPFDERNLWMIAPERMLFWYERYFSTLEKDVPLIRVDGTMALSSLTRRVRKLYIA